MIVGLSPLIMQNSYSGSEYLGEKIAYSAKTGEKF